MDSLEKKRRALGFGGGWAEIEKSRRHKNSDPFTVVQALKI